MTRLFERIIDEARRLERMAAPSEELTAKSTREARGAAMVVVMQNATEE
jgi:hypothetical protein